MSVKGLGEERFPFHCILFCSVGKMSNYLHKVLNFFKLKKIP